MTPAVCKPTHASRVGIPAERLAFDNDVLLGGTVVPEASSDAGQFAMLADTC